MLKASSLICGVIRRRQAMMGPANIIAEVSVAKPRSLRLSAWMLGWVLAVAVLLAGYGAAAVRQDFVEPDNAMRLVEVRDFIGGQAWFDTTEKRLNPPTGTPMHWARWIDAAIAAPIVVLTPVVGRHTAEVATGFIWPFGLLAVFMTLAVRLCGEIGARDGLRNEASIAGAIVTALAFPTLDKFSPGAFDHHNIELIFSFIAILGLMRMAASPRSGAMAGLALGAMMGTAAEGVPLVAAGVIVAGMLWLVRPELYRRGLVWFGGGLAAASTFMFFLLVPPAHYAQPVCDAMSSSFLGFGVAAGGVAGLLGGVLPATLSGTLVGRLGAAALLGAVALVVLFVLFPACAGGGYSALGADMKTLWLVQISEARSLATLATDNPAQALAVSGSAFAGLIAAGVYLWRKPTAESWIVTAFLLAAWGMLIWQIRGSYLVTAFAIPFGAWAAARARQAWQAKPSPLGMLMFVAVAATSAAAVWASLGQQVQARFMLTPVASNYAHRQATAKDCLTSQAFAPLTAIPNATMLNEFMLGAAAMQWTSHSVMAGPYHRDAAGTMAVINALRARPDAAKSAIMASAADYVLVCPALPETNFYANHPADGALPADTLAARLKADAPPEWLKRVPLSGTPLQLYRIER
jgi:hypothetical protein